MKPDLSVKISPNLVLKNPITLASGTAGYGDIIEKHFYPISKLGAVFTKGLTLRPNFGNRPPRMCETASGVINSIGMTNVGIDAFISRYLPILSKTNAIIIANILGSSTQEYIELAEKLEDSHGVGGIEMNISCPNVSSGGLHLGKDAKGVERLVSEIKKRVELPIIVKLSIEGVDIVEMGMAAESGGADAVSAINTIPAMAIDPRTRRPKIGNVSGGLSGPAIKPIALKKVYDLARSLSIPVIGVGGISTLEDVLEFIIAGASAVQIGTANLVDPYVGGRLVDELEGYFIENKIKSVEEIRGSLKEV
jgi:dihydroorotate dehydrogenase (NAD+) catalytic subunit